MKQAFLIIDEYRQANKTGAVGTVVGGDPQVCPTGTKFLIADGGRELIGQFPNGLLIQLEAEIRQVFEMRTARVLNVQYQGINLKIFVDPVFPLARLVILGGGHIALPLASIGKLLGYEVTVIDDRLSFANQARFPMADRVICEDFRKAIGEISFDSNTYTVIVTRGHRHDKTCLEEVLRLPTSGYIGMIGSRRKVAALFQDLQEEGFGDAELNRVYTPIGLDIGAQTPEEIAVSIMAEIIMVNRRGYSHGLKMQQGGNASGRKSN